MRHERGTFYLQEETLERLRAFCEKSGISQSQVVDGLLIQGLEHLERDWPPDVLIRGVFADGKAQEGIKKAARSRSRSRKVSST